MKTRLILMLALIFLITGCSTTATKPKPFKYQEWHDVHINKNGEKCTYTQPQKTEFLQKFEDGVSTFVDGTLGGVLGVDEKCRTLAEWGEINDFVNTVNSVKGGVKGIKQLNSALQ
jgi:hypothetical protein